LTLNLDRAADPATVSGTTIVLHNVDSGNTIASNSVGCASTPCMSIVFDPQPAPLPEGRYTLNLNGVKSLDEGLTFQPYAATYAVPFLESNSVDASGGTCALPTPTTQAVAITAPPASESATLGFDWSFAGGSSWTVDVLRTSDSQVLGTTGGGSGSGHVSIPFQIPAGTPSLTIRVTRACPTAGSSPGTLDTSNMIGSRVP
jgi:hypothetical protein